MKQPGKSLPISVFIMSGFILMGILSVGYSLFDLQYPARSVSEFYGMEVISRLLWLGMVTILMFWGMARFVRTLKEKDKRWRLAGTIVVMCSASALLWTALSDSSSRKLWERRQGYVSRNTEELLRMMRDDDEESGWAINALQSRNDPEAEPALCEILLDESEKVKLRADAAFALARIGGKQAREALEKVRASNPPGELMNSVEYAIEMRMILGEKAFEDSKADETSAEPIDSPPESKP